MTMTRMTAIVTCQLWVEAKDAPASPSMSMISSGA